MELKPGMYVRTKDGYIAKFIKVEKYLEDGETIETTSYQFDRNIDKYSDCVNYAYAEDMIAKACYNIIDLIEYMDLLVIENKLKDIDNREIYLFNPVRCDGFTEFEGGKRCMIINMDYIIPIENIKVYQVLTHEIFECNSYKVGD